MERIFDMPLLFVTCVIVLLNMLLAVDVKRYYTRNGHKFTLTHKIIALIPPISVIAVAIYLMGFTLRLQSNCFRI